MTRLELVQRLASEATGGAGPSSTLNQIYESKRLVNWIDDAYEHVQNLFTNWKFLRADFSFNTSATVSNYTSVSIPLPELNLWIDDSFKCYLTSDGVNVERELDYWAWEDFRRIYLFGANRTVPGPPMSFTIKPDNSLLFWPVPDNIYTITGEYYKRPQLLVADADEPLIPARYQKILVWWALQLYAGFSNAPEKYATGKEQYGILLQKLVLNQVPDIKIAGPLV